MILKFPKRKKINNLIDLSDWDKYKIGDIEFYEKNEIVLFKVKEGKWSAFTNNGTISTNVFNTKEEALKSLLCITGEIYQSIRNILEWE